jgi:hypothetical protein
LAHRFHLTRESLKRRYAVYVVVARSPANTRLYVGKTGDNREGCNPLISRCGNHFSYNDIHSQVRNKLSDHERRDYTYIFDHFDPYFEEEGRRRVAIDRINEMERWLNLEIQVLAKQIPRCRLLNPLLSKGYISRGEQQKRGGFRTASCERKIREIVAEVSDELSTT